MKVQYQFSTEEENLERLKRATVELNKKGPGRTSVSGLVDYLVCKGLREFEHATEENPQAEGAL